ncbi:MAG: phosphoribosylamine--glycine ligase [Candidatus Marinimicrobia bacterium]|nr:phosphoribosylamine--glycine ligase [Candidatus Neomarinimicrobiota bacterium]
MNILVIGSGGREHTIVWKLNKSNKVDQIYCAPGNAGTGFHGENIEISDTDADGLLQFAKSKDIDLTIVGPEAPLMEGVVDQFEEAGLAIFGPTKAGAQLEGSKVFAKNFMAENNIPTADFAVCDNQEQVKKGVEDKKFPYVLKVDGLAAGKGVFIIKNSADLEHAIKTIYKKNKFGEAANQVLIEDFQTGEELSVFAVTDGRDYVVLHPAQDHKQVYDGDKGPNTGGMGAYAPAPLGTPGIIKKTEEQVIKPTLKGMRDRGTPYKGVLYCGLMIDENGNPSVLEFNARFGDPEAQVIVPTIESGFVDLLESVAQGKLKKNNFKLIDKYATCVVMASGGYPVDYEKEKIITGLDKLENSESLIFLAGVRKENAKFLTNGGRVLSVVCFGDDLKESISKTYQNIEKINFDKAHYRTDIGAKGLK